MSFRKFISFNTHDCSVDTDERIRVELGLSQRCGLTLRAAIRLGSECVSVEDATAHINKRRNCLYSEGDIHTAFKKLQKLDMVECVGRRAYRVLPGAEGAWKEYKTRK